MKMEMINKLHRYDINRPRHRHGHKYSEYKKCLNMMMLKFTKQHQATLEAQFMKTSSNTEAELKKSVAYKKKRVFIIEFSVLNFVFSNLKEQFSAYQHLNHQFLFLNDLNQLEN